MFNKNKYYIVFGRRKRLGEVGFFIKKYKENLKYKNSEKKGKEKKRKKWGKYWGGSWKTQKSTKEEFQKQLPHPPPLPMLYCFLERENSPKTMCERRERDR